MALVWSPYTTLKYSSSCCFSVRLLTLLFFGCFCGLASVAITLRFFWGALRLLVPSPGSVVTGVPDCEGRGLRLGVGTAEAFFCLAASRRTLTVSVRAGPPGQTRSCDGLGSSTPQAGSTFRASLVASTGVKPFARKNGTARGSANVYNGSSPR